MMARQRMVSDDFWVDPDLADLTTEQRTCLLLFLTCKESNVIGIYRVIWRAVGSGMGWTHDQILNAARDLKRKNCVDINEDSGWVWVKEWWKHNSLRGAFTGNVAKKAAQELTQVPDFWGADVRVWLSANDSEGACKPLLSALQGTAGNPTTSIIPIPTPTTTLTTSDQQVVVADLEELIEAAAWSASRVGPLRNEAGFRRRVRERLRQQGPNPEDILAQRAYRSHQDSERDRLAREGTATAAREQHEQQWAAQAEQASTYLATLAPDEHSALVSDFAQDLAARNPAVFRHFRISGLKARIVEVELLKFVAARYILHDQEAA